MERLLRIRWWDWPDERMREQLAWFSRPITEFVEHFDPAPGDPPHAPPAGEQVPR